MPWDTSRVFETKVGLDLQGGLRVEYQVQPVNGKTPGAGDLEVIRTIIENRVNSTGVSEPVITVQGSDRIVVELPGVSDPNAIRSLVGQTGLLEFVPLGQTVKNKGDLIDDTQFPPLFGGTELSSATIGQNQTGNRVVTFQLKDNGAKLFADYTADHVGDYFAIVLDDQVISAPVDQQAIPGGQRARSSRAARSAATRSRRRRARHRPPVRLAAVPDPGAVDTERSAPTLGEQFLNQSLARRRRRDPAGHAVFMLIYYRLPGVIASFALMYYTLVVLRDLPAHPGDPDPRRRSPASSSRSAWRSTPTS